MHRFIKLKNRGILLVKFLFIFFFTGYVNAQSIPAIDSIPATIIAIQPTRGSAGTVVEIKGTHFNPNIEDNEFKFFSAKARITKVTPTSITAIVPNKARTGKVELKKRINANNRVTRTKGPVFTVDLPDAPVLTSISKTNGTVGTIVTLTGKNFNNITADGLTLNMLVVPILKRTKKSIIVKIPASATTGRFELTDTVNQRTVLDTIFTVHPPKNFKIAFFADSGIGPNADAVLRLVKNEGAHAVVHPGDLNYKEVPIDFENHINAILGADFPYFYSVGNHDYKVWDGSDGYQLLLEDRFRRLGIAWKGRLGVDSSFTYQGMTFVSAAPNELGVSPQDAGQHIKEALTKTSSVWNIAFWHKNQTLMQIGGKSDEAGWDVYEESRMGGAIMATGHEHSYSRTHEMSNFRLQEISGTGNNIIISKDDPETDVDEGRSFAFVSGIGGRGLRGAYEVIAAKPWWANTYYKGNGAQYGALFGEFNYKGDVRLARFYFKNIDGVVRDEFFVRSNN